MFLLLLLTAKVSRAAPSGSLSASPPPVARIPFIRTESFAGTTVALPEALRGQPAILILGFSEASRAAVTLWGTRLVHKTPGTPPAMFYEMPVLASVPKMLRGFVLGRVKAAVAEPARPHFLPLLDHEAEWRALTHYTVADDAYVLLVDGSGAVRWQMQGPPTDAICATLTQQVLLLQSAARAGK